MHVTIDKEIIKLRVLHEENTHEVKPKQIMNISKSPQINLHVLIFLDTWEVLNIPKIPGYLWKDELQTALDKTFSWQSELKGSVKETILLYGRSISVQLRCIL